MLRAAVASALLLSTGTCLRVEPLQKQATPLKKYGGPEHRGCAKRKQSMERDRCPKCRSKVIGGTVVENTDEFPFLAWLGDIDGTRLGQFCGGSLITDRIVLTAGHCLYESDASNANMWVRLKLSDYGVMDGIARKVINWKRHPQFSGITLHNDLTLLLLNESVPEDLVKPVRRSNGTRPFEHSGEKTVAGWGSVDEPCMVYDTLLRKARVPMGEDGPECFTKNSNKLSGTDDYDADSQLCAGDYDGTMRYPGCGDSGGPLMAVEDGEYVQVGMVSWSYGIPYPDVFTRISHFNDWIDQTIDELVAEGTHSVLKPVAER